MSNVNGVDRNRAKTLPGLSCEPKSVLERQNFLWFSRFSTSKKSKTQCENCKDKQDLSHSLQLINHEHDVKDEIGETEMKPIKSILNHRIEDNGQRSYLIHWMGCDVNAATWEFEDNFCSKDVIVEYFLERIKNLTAENRENRSIRKK